MLLGAAIRLLRSTGYVKIASVIREGPGILAQGSRRSILRRFRVIDYRSIRVYWLALSFMWSSVHPIILPTLVARVAPASLTCLPGAAALLVIRGRREEVYHA